MWKDPIVTETRELREQYAQKFNHDVDAIFDDILNRQETTSRKKVTFQPRPPEPSQDVA